MIEKVKNSENITSTVGSLLKETRLARGLTLANVVQITRIRLNYINALENDDYKELPERTYAIGYLRKYAELLDINPEMLIAKIEENYKFVEPFKGKFVEKYSDSITQDIDNNNKVFLDPIVENTNKDSNPMISQFYKDKQIQKEKDKEKKYKEENNIDKGFKNTLLFHSIKSNIKPIMIIFVCVIISIIFIYTVFFNRNKSENSKKIITIDSNASSSQENKESEFLELDQEKRNTITEEALSKEETTEQANKVNDISSSKNQQAKNTEEAKLQVEKQANWPTTEEPSRITIKVISKSWVKIYSKEKNEYYFDKILSDGAMIQIPGGVDDLLLTVGDYTGVVVIVDGVEVKLKKKGKSSVMRGVKLESDFLLNTFGAAE